MRHPTCFLLLLIAALALVTSEAAAQSWPDLSSPGEAQGGGERDAALIVGVGDYVFAPDIEGATASAQDWYVFLTRSRQVPVGNVVLLRDAEGTRESLLEAAATAASRVGRGGTLWFIYVGHGAPAADGKEGVLVGADAQRSASSLYARSVRQSELFELFEQGKQARTVAVLDACFSGQVGGGESLVSGLQPFLPVKASSGDTLVLTAGGSDEFAGPLPRAKRPAFSYLALGALRGWADANGDGRVTGREVTDYTRDALRVLLRDRVQTPAITGPGQDEPLAELAAEPGPDLGGLVIGDRSTPAPQDSAPAPAAPNIFGGGQGFARLSFGLNSFSAGSYSAATTETEVKHNQDSIFTSFPLDVTDAGALSLQGVGLDLMLGQEGLLLGASLDLLWLSGDPVPVRVSTVSDSFSEGVPELVAGVDGTLSDYLRFDASALLGYRVLLGSLGLFVQGGAGISFASLELSFKLDGIENTVSALEPQLVVPLEAGADFLLYKNLFVHAVYSFYAVPSGSQSISGGVGIYY